MTHDQLFFIERNKSDPRSWDTLAPPACGSPSWVMSWVTLWVTPPFPVALVLVSWWPLGCHSIQYTVYITQLSGVDSGNHRERPKAAEASEASYAEKKTVGTSWRLVGASWRLVGASWRLVGSPFFDPSNGAC